MQGSESSSFASLLFNQETTATSYTPARVLRAGALHWRVQAVDSSGASGWTVSSVDIGDLVKPSNVVVSPGERVLPPVSPPIISWDAVPGAVSYEVEMDAEGDGVGGSVKDVKTTTYVWPDPQGVGERQGTEDFFVRVRAKFDNGLQSEWTAYTSYDVTQLPPVTSSTCSPGLVCAPDRASGIRPRVEVQDVVFDWDPVKGAKEYEIWVALDPDFNTQIEKRKVLSTRYSPMTTYDNNTYYWKVRAYNAAGEPTPWPAAPSVFDRRWPFKPSLVYPPVSSTPVGDDVYYQWTPVRHATRYVLEVGNDENFTPGTFASCTTQSTTYVPGFASDRCMPYQGTTTYWRVRAFDGPRQVNGVYSDAGRFVYDSGRVQAISPANGSTVAVPTFRWQPSPDANAYLITLTGPAGTVTATTSALSWTPTAALPSDSDAEDPARNPDVFTWQVAAIDGDKRVSPTFTMGTVRVLEAPVAAGTTPLAPLPLASGQITSRFPALAWEPIASTVDAPVYYKLRVSETEGYVLPESATPILSTKLAYPAVTDLSTYFLRPGTRTWWVEAFDARTNARLGTGQRSTFTIEAPTRAAGHQVALDGRSVDSGHSCTKRLVVVGGGPDEQSVCMGMSATPVLDWESVPGAGGYQVYVAEDPDFTVLLYDGVQTISSRFTPSEDHSPSALPDNEAGSAYYWYVRPCAQVRPTHNCGPGPSGQIDSGAGAFRKVSPRIELESPSPDATLGNQVTFRWTDFHLTNQAASPVYGGSIPPYQTAQRYRLQVAQSATITDNNTIDDVTVDQTTYTAFTKTYPEGDLWWRVQAIDGSNNRLSWSETRKIVKATPATNLDPDTAAAPEEGVVDGAALPAFNSRQAAGSTLFRWSAEDYDASWELQVYKNDDTVPSSGNLVFTTATKQAAFVPATPLAASSEPYRWRVRRTDVGGKAGRWSDLGRFYVDPLPLQLSSPTDQAAMQPVGTAFRWASYGHAAARAAKYTIDIEPASSGATNTAAVTTAATAWTSPANLADGTYTWSVRALDVAGNSIGSSPTWTFTVDAGLRAITPAQITAPEGSSVGKTLTSVAPLWNQADVQVTYQWLRNGSAIRNAVGPAYTLTTDDYNRVVSLRVTGAKAGYVNGQSVSNEISVTAGGALQSAGAPTITGSASPGGSLRATTGSWSPAATTFRYQWLRSGVAIPGATSGSYRVTSDDAGKDVSVTVFASAAGFSEGAATAAAVAVARLGSTAAGALKASRVKVGKRAKLTVTITVTGLSTPSGVVQVLDKGKKIAQFTMAPVHKGKKTLKLRKLAKGKHRLQVVYLGNGQVFGSKSKKIVLYVIK
ncbi:Ig-like domain repeat protein [Nocardioides sp. zg-1228]|uniref:Ig-like domain repeat protein n=1 Tax=Nocardioides sp. zg-1228 TaxID=2763008 RepID=UPI0016424589|nr:Ig-like domain repeat protein [Nocardioides sp. zg-1228]MBC2933463.1 Ig-like domain repeat protein [Nocardioides sp. zg-1228]QSF56395.1 Ig-like domain repeat protein [Nocardioides sp. zg-1228]